MLGVTLRHALNRFNLDISLNVGREVMALFGQSGAGKSITLQMVAGLMRPDQGQIVIDGHSLFDSERRINLLPQQRRVGYVMQDYILFPHLSVAENIAYGLKRNHHRPDVERVVADMLTLIHLSGFADRRPDELSGGQKQRVALARALVTNPQMLLLDEPFSALDGPTRTQLRTDLRELLSQVNIPTLFVTHDLAEANLLADTIAVYHQGRILQIGSPMEIMHRPVNLEVAHLTGTENCFVGQITALTEQAGQVTVGPLRLTTPPYPFASGQRVHCCLRPEQILLLTPDYRSRSQGEAANIIEVEIISIMSDGLTYILQLRLLEARLRPDRAYDLVATLPLALYESVRPVVGQIQSILLKPSAIHLIKDPS